MNGKVVASALLLLSMNAWSAGITDGRGEVQVEEVREELEALPAELRGRLSKTQAELFVTNMFVDRRLLVAAREAGTEALPKVKWKIEKATRDILIKAYLERETEKLAASLPNIDKLARERYEVEKKSHTTTEAIKVSHILFKVDPEDEKKTESVVKTRAEQVLADLKKGADFALKAKENSEDAGTARNGGELPGWAEKGRLVPPFEEAAYKLKPGEMSGLVRTRFGYHIIKLHEYRPAGVLPYESVKESIESKIRNEMLGQKRQEFMKSFAGTQPVVIDETVLEAIRKQ